MAKKQAKKSSTEKSKTGRKEEQQPGMTLAEAVALAVPDGSIVEPVVACYTGMSELVAIADTPGKQAYPSQQRTGMKKLLAAMGVPEGTLKALDKEIRLAHGRKK